MSFRSTSSATCSPSQRVFEAAARDGVRVVFASSSSVYGEAERYPTPEDTPPAPLSPYGITKLACEHLAGAYGRSFGLDAVVLRYFNAFGPRQRPDMAFSKHRARARDGPAVRPLRRRRAVARLDVRRRRRRRHDAGDGEGDRHVQRRRRRRGHDAGGDRDLEGLAGRTLEIRRIEPVPGDQRRTNADTTRIRAELGWAPRISLEDGLRAQWEWASATVGAQ